MRLGQVLGNVVLSRVHPSLIGAQFKIVLPLTFDDLVQPWPTDAAEKTSEEEKKAGCDADASTERAAFRLLNPEIPRKWGMELIVYDDCSAAVDEWIAFSEGAEAAAAFYPNQKPVDAFGAAIIDSLVVDGPAVAALTGEKKNFRPCT